MSDEISDTEAARLGCAGFGCGVALIPILLVTAALAFFSVFMTRG